jgi:hypothetical protein
MEPNTRMGSQTKTTYYALVLCLRPQTTQAPMLLDHHVTRDTGFGLSFWDVRVDCGNTTAYT